MEAAKGGAAGNEDSEGNSATLLDDPCPGVDEDAAAVPVSGSPPVAAPRLHASSSSAANDLGAHASLDPGLRRLGADSEAAISAKGEVIVFDASAPASPSPPRTRHLATSDTDTEEARAGSSEDGEGNTPPPGAPLKPAGSAPVAGHPRHASSASASPPALTEGETIAPSVHAPRLTPTRRVTQDFVVDGFAISPEGDVITGALDIITPAVPENTATTAMGTGSAGRAANNDGDTTFDEYYSSPAPPRANAFDAPGTAANAGSSASATSAADGGAQPSGPTVRTPCVTLGLPGLHEVATFNVASSCKVSVSEDMPLALSGEGTRPQVAFANEADSSEGAWILARRCS